MTKSELKDLIKECINECNEELANISEDTDVELVEEGAKDILNKIVNGLKNLLLKLIRGIKSLLEKGKNTKFKSSLHSLLEKKKLKS